MSKLYPKTMHKAYERITLDQTWKNRKTTKLISEKTTVRDSLETIGKLKWNRGKHEARRKNKILDLAADTQETGKHNSRWQDLHQNMSLRNRTAQGVWKNSRMGPANNL